MQFRTLFCGPEQIILGLAGLLLWPGGVEDFSTIMPNGAGEREGYVSEALVCIAKGYLAGLRNGPPPSGLNGLDSWISRNDGDDS